MNELLRTAEKIQLLDCRTIRQKQHYSTTLTDLRPAHARAYSRDNRGDTHMTRCIQDETHLRREDTSIHMAKMWPKFLMQIWKRFKIMRIASRIRILSYSTLRGMKCQTEVKMRKSQPFSRSRCSRAPCAIYYQIKRVQSGIKRCSLLEVQPGTFPHYLRRRYGIYFGITAHLLPTKLRISGGLTVLL